MHASAAHSGTHVRACVACKVCVCAGQACVCMKRRSLGFSLQLMRASTHTHTCAADASVVELKDLLLCLHHQGVINAHLWEQARDTHTREQRAHSACVWWWCWGGGPHLVTVVRLIDFRASCCMCAGAGLLLLLLTSPNSFSMTAIFFPWLPAGACMRE